MRNKPSEEGQSAKEMIMGTAKKQTDEEDEPTNKEQRSKRSKRTGRARDWRQSFHQTPPDRMLEQGGKSSLTTRRQAIIRHQG